MTHNDYLIKVLSTRVDYDWAYWYQCTDLAKDYARSVLWINPWSFGWAAKNANQSTFPWTTIYMPWPWKDLKQGDILIQDWFPWNIYGHVWVIHKAERFGYYLIEQNAKTWNWGWVWNDAVRVNYYNRSERTILRFFRK